jgi:hypothetical protein
MEYSRIIDTDKYDVIGGKLVPRADYKKKIIEAELNGLSSQKEYLQGQLNVFSDRLLTIEEKFEEKKKELKELE